MVVINKVCHDVNEYIEFSFARFNDRINLTLNIYHINL